MIDATELELLTGLDDSAVDDVAAELELLLTVEDVALELLLLLLLAFADEVALLLDVELTEDDVVFEPEATLLELEEVSALDALALLVFDEFELLTALLADESVALVADAVATELLATLDSAGIMALSPVASTS
ncbi:hypothetical protein [Pediococcus claussenii]|uniref:hypothetical protein n=1 Tax=Pediococcus claussenii TaxID=187452 RepID=UPI0002EE9EDB|nr:hypothetical protein [Pediococcus claussenii]KRN18829.1 hypothetical protein IV79_GL000327 [Pediococcus claussenii]